MPQLPTITVTDAQQTLIVAAFGDEATYLSWLRDRVVGYVLEQEQKRMAADALAAQRQALTTLQTQLETSPAAHSST